VQGAGCEKKKGKVTTNGKRVVAKTGKQRDSSKLVTTARRCRAAAAQSQHLQQDIEVNNAPTRDRERLAASHLTVHRLPAPTGDRCKEIGVCVDVRVRACES
jgi:hypothetical protein